MADYLKLVSARVTNFTCFEDTGEVPIDPQVTVLLAEKEEYEAYRRAWRREMGFDLDSVPKD